MVEKVLNLVSNLNFNTRVFLYNSQTITKSIINLSDKVKILL